MDPALTAGFGLRGSGKVPQGYRVVESVKAIAVSDLRLSMGSVGERNQQNL